MKDAFCAKDEEYMQRCLLMASWGSGWVSTNPMVGAVLVHNEEVIGAGYHQKYGGAHAEVNCIQSVSVDNQHKIASSTLYVSLEPCCHFGKTPPCTDLIIKHKIPCVVIGSSDENVLVKNKGIQVLQEAGIEVRIGLLEEECKKLNKRFFTFHQLHRPYVTLKWAQTINGIMGSPVNTERLIISNEITNRLVHKWRSEEAGIVIGFNTALCDNPSLTIRHWKGKNPVRILLDIQAALPPSLHVFTDRGKTIVFNHRKNETQENITWIKMEDDDAFLPSVLNNLYKLGIHSLLVEGGPKTLQSFIENGLWDEARIITNNNLHVVEGTKAPLLCEAMITESYHLFTDHITHFTHETQL